MTNIPERFAELAARVPRLLRPAPPAPPPVSPEYAEANDLRLWSERDDTKIYIRRLERLLSVEEAMMSQFMDNDYRLRYHMGRRDLLIESILAITGWSGLSERTRT